MIYLLYAIHLLVCIFLILVVLLQQGKGADLSVFGGGSTQTAFGAVGATSLLHRLTVTSFVLFIVTTMTIAILSGQHDEGVMSGFTEDQMQELATGGDAVSGSEAPAPVAGGETPEEAEQAPVEAPDEETPGGSTP